MTLDGTDGFHTKMEKRGNVNSQGLAFPLVCIFCKIAYIKYTIKIDKMLREMFNKFLQQFS